MTTLAIALRNEITRLARKELRAHIDPLKKASSAQRREIAELKRQVATLSRQVKTAGRTTGKTSGKSPAPTDEQPAMRFGAKGLRSLRTRLGLSAADFGTLAGVSAQSIYNWESGKTVPRKSQLPALGQLRGLGKREALARLEQSGQ